MPTNLKDYSKNLLWQTSYVVQSKQAYVDRQVISHSLAYGTFVINTWAQLILR